MGTCMRAYPYCMLRAAKHTILASIRGYSIPYAYHSASYHMNSAVHVYVSIYLYIRDSESALSSLLSESRPDVRDYE